MEFSFRLFRNVTRSFYTIVSISSLRIDSRPIRVLREKCSQISDVHKVSDCLFTDVMCVQEQKDVIWKYNE